MIIVPAPADRRKTSASIHLDRGITVADLEVDARNALVASAVEEMIEKQRPDAPTLLVGEYGNEEQLRFVRDRSDQGKADYGLVRLIDCKR